MLLFALFTLGYFAGVVTALAIFPPRTNELREQELDAASPIYKIKANDGDVKSPSIAIGNAS